ncbi:MAG: glycyl-radical enzyme activating protein [Eubacteriales bacterium]|nr:glycyl-radical enzyme activating protein [Eubacteriales bacterium]
MVKGLIADVQRASTHDGPGIRTVIFFKGCPLSCVWCHNPECIEPCQEWMYYPEKCIYCGKCQYGCFAGAKVICGSVMTTGELMEELLLDKAYYRRGGVTFSGGEPLLQGDFLEEMLKNCREVGIHTAIETSLCIFRESIFAKADFVMADLKVWDSKIHKECTGIENEGILENFRKLNRMGVKVAARTPVIPEINQNIPEISGFLKTLENVISYELLPYHSMGITKAAALGRNMKVFTTPSPEKMEELKKYAYIR